MKTIIKPVLLDAPPARIEFSSVHLVHGNVTIHLNRITDTYYIEFPAQMQGYARGSFGLLERFGYFVDFYDESLHEFDSTTGLVRWRVLPLDETFDED